MVVINITAITTPKTMESKLEGFEMWACRRMLWLSWTEHKTNELMILRMANTTSSLWPTIKKRKCQYFGHVIRARSIPKLLLERKIKGKRGQGRPRITWMKNVKEWLGHTYKGCVRSGEDRNIWRSMIADLLLVDGTWWWLTTLWSIWEYNLTKYGKKWDCRGRMSLKAKKC